MKTSEILQLLDEIDDDDLESGDIVLHIPEEHDRPVSDVDSDYSDEENAGDLNKLGPGLLNSMCDFVPHSKHEENEEEIEEEPTRRTRLSYRSKKKRDDPIPHSNPVESVEDIQEEPTRRTRQSYRLEKKKEETIPQSSPEEDEEEIEGPTRRARKSYRSKKKNEVPIVWSSEKPKFSIITDKSEHSDISADIISAESEYEIFRLFIDDQFIEHVVEQTNLYAEQRNKNLNVSKFEILVMVGGFLLSGYAKYTNKRFYWNRDSDCPTILSDAIRCNRFEDILHHIHFNNNQQNDGQDRLYKLRPLLDHMQRKFLALNPLEEHLSIDESMIPYYGRHFAKQYIRGKPIRFGYKNWALCSSSGYMYAFDIYVGKTEQDTKTELGAGGDVVMNLIKKAGVKEHEGYKLYFDNYFTSIKLLNKLSSLGICATGTVRENRLSNCPLPKKETFKKTAKHSHQFAASSTLLVVKYNDNNVVNVATNFDSADVTTIKRFCTKKKSQVSIPKPIVIDNYNNFMGGVDQMDQWVANYRTRMRQKKWWWPIFCYFIDVAVVNSWILWKKKTGNNALPLISFRRKVAIVILKKYGVQSKQGKQSAPVVHDVRYDGMNHWLRECKPRRCGNCVGKASFYCTKCNVGLHPRCHEEYHVNK